MAVINVIVSIIILNNIKDPPRRRHGVFIGAAFYADVGSEDMWISKQEYEEKGARCVHAVME